MTSKEIEKHVGILFKSMNTGVDATTDEEAATLREAFFQSAEALVAMLVVDIHSFFLRMKQ